MFLTVTDADKAGVVGIAGQLHDLGFRIVATRGTAAAIKRMGIPVETINKIQDGSQQRRRLDRPRRRRPRDQHADRHRGALGRLRDPPRGDRARRAVHHDDRGRDGGRAGDRGGARGRAAGASRCRSCTATLAQAAHASAGLAAEGHGREPDARAARAPARGDLRVPARRRPTTSSCCDDPEGPEPDPGQFYMLAAAERWGGGADERPFLPRAFSVMRRDRRPAGVHARGRRPGHARAWASCARATGCGSPARSGSASRRRARIAARCSSAAAWAPRRWRSGRTHLGLRHARGLAPASRDARRPAGFRDAEHARGRSCTARASRPTTARSATRARSPTCCSPSSEPTRTSRSTACGPPGMLEAVRAICAEHDVPAQLALESGMACGYGACFGCVVRDHERLRPPVRRRPGPRRGTTRLT